MNGRLGLKVFVCVIVVAACAFVGVYPLVAGRFHLLEPDWVKAEHLRLGLDLRGGVQLLLGVRTGDAVGRETEAAAERLRDELAKHGMVAATVAAPDATHVRVTGVTPAEDALLGQLTGAVLPGYEQTGGVAGERLFAMKPPVEASLREEAILRNRESLERRVNDLGVSEPGIARQGRDGDRILVQLPGVFDVERAKAILRSTGFLELKLVERGPVASGDGLMADGRPPAGLEIVSGVERGAGSAPAYYLVRKAAAVTGKDVRTARPTVDANNRPAVAFSLTADGAQRFARATGDNVGRALAIVLDGSVQSVARIDGRIAGEGRIYGAFTAEDAQNLALVLRSGALAARMELLEQRTIGPTLGADAIRSGITASLVGLVLLVAFMLAYYRLSGLNAVVALGCNLVMLIGLMAHIGAVMTLPGIAAFVLTMGMGVDSNVLIFERIKEEIESGRGVRASVAGGFGRVFLTLLDTHIAALISCAFLFRFGTGPVRGFATTLFIGLASNLFTSMFVSKTVFELMLSGKRRAETLSI